MAGDGTIAVIIGVLTVVTTAKGVAGAAKKGTGAVGAPKKLHNNDLKTLKPAEGYSLRDRKTDGVLKYGETTLGKGRYTKKFLQKHNARMVIEATGSKKEMHQWQHEKILEYKVNSGGQRPPLNKSDW